MNDEPDRIIHPGLIVGKHRVCTQRNIDLFNDVVYTTLSYKAIGLKYDITTERVRSIFYHLLRVINHPANNGEYGRFAFAANHFDFDDGDWKKYQRNIPACVIDDAFDPNVSHPMDVKDAIVLAQLLNDEKRCLLPTEQFDPDRVRKVPVEGERMELPETETELQENIYLRAVCTAMLEGPTIRSVSDEPPPPPVRKNTPDPNTTTVRGLLLLPGTTGTFESFKMDLLDSEIYSGRERWPLYWHPMDGEIKGRFAMALLDTIYNRYSEINKETGSRVAVMVVHTGQFKNCIFCWEHMEKNPTVRKYIDDVKQLHRDQN
jgi:hypothetical protein